MCITSTEGRFTVDRSGEGFIFINNLYTKKGDTKLLLISIVNGM